MLDSADLILVHFPVEIPELLEHGLLLLLAEVPHGRGKEDRDDAGQSRRTQGDSALHLEMQKLCLRGWIYDVHANSGYSMYIVQPTLFRWCLQ